MVVSIEIRYFGLLENSIVAKAIMSILWKETKNELQELLQKLSQRLKKSRFNRYF